jgi:hypothetical protein
MRHEFPTVATVHIHPQMPGMLDRLCLPAHSHNITIGPSHNSHISEETDMILFNLKQVKRELPLGHVL